VAASLGKRLFWRDTGEPVKLDNFFKHYGSSLRHTAWAARRAYVVRRIATTPTRIFAIAHSWF